jgi:hypothetical protein
MAHAIKQARFLLDRHSIAVNHKHEFEHYLLAFSRFFAIVTYIATAQFTPSDCRLCLVEQHGA